MEHSELKFSGINRKVSDYSNAGACEELINLRPLETGLEVVKKKGTLFGAGNITNLFVHHTSLGDVYIGEEKSYQSYKSYYRLNSVFAPAEPLGTYSVNSDIAFLGDYAVISDKENYTTAVYRWGGTNYTSMESTVPGVNIEVTYEDYPTTPPADLQALTAMSTCIKDFIKTTDPDETVTLDRVKAEAESNAIMEYVRSQNPDRCYGMCILAFNYTLVSGEEFWTFKYVPVDPYYDLIENYTPESSTWSTEKYPLIIIGAGGAPEDWYMFMPSAKIKVRITRTGTYNAERSLIKCVNVYSTVPTAPYRANEVVFDSSQYFAALASPDTAAYTEYASNALFYKQFSMNLAETAQADRYLQFGSSASIQARPVLQVDAGPTQRFGEMLAYNNRLHYYDSVAHTLAYPAEFNPDGSTRTTATTKMSYKLKSGTQWAQVSASVPSTNPNRYLVCCPDARIDRLGIGSTGYPMTPSNRYNFSFNFTRNMPTVTVQTGGANAYVDNPEPREVNVTGQLSPLEFPVEYSYDIGGVVQNLVINNDNLTESQTGQWPIYAYTDRGVFAMEQGNGQVLYAKVTPVSMLVAESNVASTPYGQFFISGGHLYNLKGKHAVIVSDALESEPNKELRETDSYQEMFNGDLYGIIGLESSVDFRTFCKNATVTFDPFADEIIVSNLSQTSGGYDYPYSYVLDLRRRQWHKIDTNSFPAGNTTTIAKMFTTASLGARAVGRIQVKVSDLYAHPIYSEADYTMFTSDEVTCNVTSFPAGTTLTVRRVDNQYIGSTYVTTENTPAKIALAKLFPMSLVDMSAPVYDIEYLSNGKYRLLLHYGSTTAVGSPAWAIYRGEEQSPIMTFTFSDTPITARFQKKSTGVTCTVALGADSVQFSLGNAAAATIGSSEALLAQEIADAINSSPRMPATASRNGSIVTLVAKEAGPAYNRVVAVSPVYSSNKDAFYNVSVTNMTGGSAGGQNDYFCNLAAEEEDPIRLVHLESRPVSFGYALSHILRTVLLVKARLQALSGVVAISVFGSDDLFSWKCISTGQKKAAEAQLTINRIRNNRASHSWRYYKVCIGGYVPTEADIAQVIVDWYAINRRIG